MHVFAFGQHGKGVFDDVRVIDRDEHLHVRGGEAVFQILLRKLVRAWDGNRAHFMQGDNGKPNLRALP